MVAAPEAPAESPLQMANWGLDAARHDAGWAAWVWPSLSPEQEVDDNDLQVIWRRARMLYHNCPGIRAAVLNMVRFTGELTPLPMSSDPEWNELAAAAFRRRTRVPGVFDLAGRLNFTQAQAFMERCAVVDGDVGMVLTRGADGGAAFAFFRAPQIAGAGRCGVEVDAHNRARAYYVTGEDGATARIPAEAMVLYHHHPDCCAVRGVSELVAAIRHGQDIREIVGYSKQAVKLAASFGLVETKPADDKTPHIAMNVGAAARVGGAASGSAMGARVNAAVQVDDSVREVIGMGVKVTSLAPGRDLKAITDTRPSQQVQQFVDHLIGCIAWSVGLEPEVLFFGSRMGSAAVRFSLEKLKAWQRERLEDRVIVCDRIWQHVLACEMASGRLRACRAEDWQEVRWIPSRDMTIDLGRVAASQINLVREGLADADEWTLATCGKTVRQIAESRAANLRYIREVAEQYGVPFEILSAGAGMNAGNAVPEGAVPAPAAHDEEGEDEQPPARPDEEDA